MGLKIKDTVMSPGIVIRSGDNWMLDTLMERQVGLKIKDTVMSPGIVIGLVITGCWIR